MDFVEYVYAASETGTEDIARLFMDGLNTFITPVSWTFPEWFDTSMETASEAVTEFFGISGYR